MRTITLFTLFIIFVFVGFSFLFPLRCFPLSSVLPFTNPSPQHNVLFFSTIQQEGITKILHMGRYGKLQNALNDYFYKFIFERMLYWARRTEQARNGGISQGNGVAPPLHTIFLGDQFSSEHLFDDQFREQLHRFHHHVFRKREGVHQIHLAGNNDVGYGYSLSTFRLERFETAFDTPQNHMHSIGGVDFVWPLSLVLDGSEPKFMKKTWKFIEHLAEQRSNSSYTKPLVLLTHIPLYKDDKSHSCRSSFRMRKSDDGMVQMQTQLSLETTKRLLTLLRPNVIISGHDHSGCKVVHQWNVDGVTYHAPEYVQRSMQGDYGGHSGVLSFGTASESSEWEFSYETCGYTYIQVVVVFLVIMVAEVLLISVLMLNLVCRLVWRLLLGFLRLLWKAIADKRKHKVE